ncbi:ABC transporter permease [Labrys monachus]|uniref:Peptide/nickel transport system permease protein n=1 Tax=Labrys monachus TaxID=217067 RepID=A0ABU0F9I1_9HYPH|nr:ABC transporter permease [Labrys monachus]MDQ0391270.1 peptide/nickel transport system permease protein [Labrys monachus]
MTGLLLRRFAGAVVVLALVVVGAFFLLEAAPGDAIDAYVAGIGGADAGRIAQLRTEWGLDRGPVPRLGAYAVALLHGDLGWSTGFQRPVRDLLLERLPVTFAMMGSALAMALLLGVVLGFAAGARPDVWLDRILSVGSLALYAMPGFWLSLVLIAVFSVSLRWLPASGFETIASDKTGLARGLDIARHLVLPVSSLGLVYMTLFLRLLRDGMEEIWSADFIRAARARGISGLRLSLRHVACNALAPVITMLGLQSASLLGGSVVIESVFAIPGFGRLAAEAVARRDTPLLLGVVLCSAVVVLAMNLLADAAQAWLDPRIGTAGGSQ